MEGTGDVVAKMESSIYKVALSPDGDFLFTVGKGEKSKNRII